MFLTNNPFSDHGPSKQVLSEAFKYHIPEDIPANERTAFHGAAAAAAKAGKKNFNFGGKTHPVTMKKDTAKSIPTEALDKKDVKTVKGVIKGLKKAVATHSSQVKTLTKDIKDSTQVKEISKRTAANYISKASRDTYHLGQRQGKADAIDRIGGTHPDQKYKSGPERKAVKRVVGIDRAARRLATGKGYYAQKEDNAALQKKLDKLYNLFLRHL